MGQDLAGVGNDDSCSNDISVNDAKTLCNRYIQCSGFFHYDTTQNARACFKKNVDTSNNQILQSSRSNLNGYANAGFYVVHGEKPDIVEGDNSC